VWTQKTSGVASKKKKKKKNTKQDSEGGGWNSKGGGVGGAKDVTGENCSDQEKKVKTTGGALH